MSGTLILVVGPSGVGKDTLMDGARVWLDGDSRFRFAQRDITRPKEAGGEDHNPVSVESFNALRSEGAYALSWGAHELFYGIRRETLRDLDDGRSVIVNASRSILNQARLNFPKVAIVSVTAPEALLRQRLQARGRETASQIEKRIERATAFQIAGGDVHNFSNTAGIETGISEMTELLVKIDGRLFGQIDRGRRSVLRKGAYLLSIKDDKVLVAVEAGNPHFQLPGGGLDEGETHLQALARETLEEVGHKLVGTPKHLCDVSGYAEEDSLATWHKLCRFFVSDVEYECEPQEPSYKADWIPLLTFWDQASPLGRFVLTKAGLAPN